MKEKIEILNKEKWKEERINNLIILERRNKKERKKIKWQMKRIIKERGKIYVKTKKRQEEILS